jgi:hypothetical protein
MTEKMQSGWNILLLVTVGLWASGVNADGFYIGAGAYKTDVSIDDFDDHTYTPAAFVGYQFIDTNFLMLSAELGYYDLGSYDSNDVDVDASALTLAGVAYLPIGPLFEIYAKAGIASGDVEVKEAGIKDDFDGENAFGGILLRYSRHGRHLCRISEV